MKLSEFVSSKEEKKKSGETMKNESVGEKELEKMYDELKDKNEDELMSMLRKNIREQKEKGEFDADTLLESIKSLRGVIPEENYNNMIRIIDELQKD